ncbi:hypothetical protein DFJ73DRAFT_756739 [Zopfochytrium polystomum]|nr:hypothetical protein DFJ73DRAFT_756739 [Zopfochytrium polystomum]
MPPAQPNGQARPQQTPDQNSATAEVTARPAHITSALALIKDRSSRNRIAGGTPLFGFGAVRKNQIFDVVRQLIDRKIGRRTRASQAWALVRDHVRHGFFQPPATSTDPDSSDFLTLVSDLWALVHRCSPSATAGAGIGDPSPDSTTDFDVSGWAKIKADQYAAALVNARKSVDTLDIGGRSTVGAAATSAGKDGMSQGWGKGGKRDSASAATSSVTAPSAVSGHSGPGAAGSVSTGTAGNGVSSRKGMSVMDGGGDGAFSAVQEDSLREENDVVDEEYGGLVRSRGYYRSAQVGIEGLSLDSIPNTKVPGWLKRIAEGLHSKPLVETDFYTVQVHFNRAWKLLLLGLIQAESFARYRAMCHLKIALPTINDTLLDFTTRENIFNVLINLTISDERKENRLKAVYLLGQLALQLGAIREHDDLLLRAFNALAKKWLQLQFEEKQNPDNAQQLREENRALKIHLIHAIGKFTRYLHQYNTDFIQNLAVYMIHEEFSQGDTKLDKISAKKMGGPMLVIRNSNDGSSVHKVLEDGLRCAQEMGLANVSRDQFHTEKKELRKRRVREESKTAMRSMLLRQLLQVPGTYTKLEPALDCPGFFVDADSSLSNTKGIVVGLPVHPKSCVTVSRPLPPIPGVPSGVTTVPPVFMEKAWAEKLGAPKYRYDFLERTGKIYGLPFGFTYSPSTLVDVYEMKGLEHPTTTKLVRKTREPKVEANESRAIVAHRGMLRRHRGRGGSRQTSHSSLSRKSVMGIAYNEDDGEDVITPLRSNANAAASKLIIAAIGEARRLTSVQSGRSPVEEAGFGFVKRRSTLLQARDSGPRSSVLLEKTLSSSMILTSSGSFTRIDELKPIPTGMIRHPPKEDVKPESQVAAGSFRGRTGSMAIKDGASGPSTPSAAERRVPPGFLLVCPFPGYDPEKLDKANLPGSLIYYSKHSPKSRGNSVILADHFDYTPPGSRSGGIRGGESLPSGFTFDRNPVLWPNKNPNILSVGATFNMFLRTRSKPDEWTCINLEVLDNDYQDNIGFKTLRARDSGLGSMLTSSSSLTNSNRGKPAKPRNMSPGVGRPTGSAGSSTGSALPSSFPLPSGFASNGDPYFAPPVSVPPAPAGYTENMAPYYGKTSAVKPQPYSLTTDGVRYYSPDGKLSEGARNALAGFDNSGQPFFVPKGCTLPLPIGFTPDGIAYYDIPSLMFQRGIMLIPSAIKDKAKWASAFAGELSELETIMDDSAELTEQLLETLMATQPEHAQAFSKGRPKAFGTVRRLKDISELAHSQSSSEEDLAVSEPDDIIEYLKESDDFLAMRPSTMRVTLEPNILDFQGVVTPVTKTSLLRYKAARGDREERDLFISVEPVDVFSVQNFHLHLQGDSALQIQITYSPSAMISEKAEGSLNVIDQNGRKLVSCSLLALKKSFISVTPSSVNAGWILPDKKKEIVLKVENTSNTPVIVNYELDSEIEVRAAATTVEALLQEEHKKEIKIQNHEVEEISSSAFRLPGKNIKVQPGESRPIHIFFEPHKFGKYSDGLQIYAPGGENICVKLSGVAGIPIALYPESAKNSLAGSEALTIERSEFIKKFERHDTQKGHLRLSEDDVSIIQNMMSASSVIERKLAHTVDFGICTLENQSLMRCLTIFNMSETPMTIGLYSHHSSVTCPYLVQIPARMATTVEIVLTIANNLPSRGNFSAAIEVICPEFQNIPLNILAYIGQPLYFACYELAFLKPIPIGKSQSLTLSLVNDSHYDFKFILKGLDSGERKENESYFTSNISSNPSTPSRINKYTIGIANIQFHAKRRGPLVSTVSLQVLHPFKLELFSTANMKNVSFIGLCIEPWAHKVGELPDKNALEYIRTWLSHPRRVLDEYAQDQGSFERRFDLSTCQETANKDMASDVLFGKEEATFRLPKPVIGLDDDFNYRRASIQQVALRNKGQAELPTILFTSPLFNVDPKTKSLRKGDGESADIMHTPANDHIDNFTTFGFGMIVSETDHKFHAIKLLGKPHSDFLLYPMPSKEGQVLFDFGRIESSSNNPEIYTKFLIMQNLFKTPFSWTVKFANSRAKFNAFEVALSSGEMQPGDHLPLPINIKGDSSGIFETSADIEVKESLDRLAKPSKVGTIILRGQIVNTSMSGFPETIDFGSVFVSHRKRRRFTVNNNGSTEARVTTLTRPPFTVTPHTFTLSPKSSQEVIVTFQPIESRTTLAKLLVFSNQKLYFVSLHGTVRQVGRQSLFVRSTARKNIEFGAQREGTVVWVHLYLTNKGTLPLTLRAVTADIPELVKMDFLSVSSTMPIESKNNGARPLVVRKDYWGILRRKFGIFSIWNSLARKKNGIPLAVFREGSLDPSELQPISTVPQLRPFYSYHVRLGYLNKYQPKKETNVYFHYMPITSEEENEPNSSLLQQMSVRVVGNVYRPLEFFPAFHDFGMVPAEAWAIVDTWRAHNQSMESKYGVQKESHPEKNQFTLEVLNLSMETQNLSLSFINSEFTVMGRHWFVSPGEKLKIPMEFHPPKEQLQYQGSAVFTHNYGTQEIQLIGTGASADVSADDIIDFGSLKLGTKGYYKLRICNRGLLEARYIIEIIQPVNHLSMMGKIGSGIAELVEIQCCCYAVAQNVSHITLKWERIPKGVWEELIIPLQVQIGIPQFKLPSLELDFTTTYINVNKTIVFPARNDGNASCSWKAEWDSPLLIIDPDSGVLEPGHAVEIFVTYAPENYEQLNTDIQFITDAGPPKVLMCYGIVGVPYLVIPPEHLQWDFGIVAVDKTHRRPISLTNTGPRPIEFEISLSDMTKDGLPAPPDDFAVFFAVPTFGTVEPGEAFTAHLECLPRNYGCKITASITVRTRDGEQYAGNATATGGRAIIKIAPPAAEPTLGERLVTADMKKKPVTAEGPLLSSKFEAARLAFQSHIENLQDVLAGLRTAEMELSESSQRPTDECDGGPVESPFADVGTKVYLTESGQSIPSPQIREDLLKLGAAEEMLAARAREEYKKKLSAGSRVFDGSDLQGRVKRAVEIAQRMESLHRDIPSTKDPKWNTDEFLQRTTSGRIRAIADPDNPGASILIDQEAEQDRPQDPASARRRQIAVGKARGELEDPAAVKYLDDLSILENELETLSRTIDAVGALVSSAGTQYDDEGSKPLTGVSGYGRYTPGTPGARINRRKRRLKGLERQGQTPLPLQENDSEEKVGQEGNIKMGLARQPVEDLMALAQQILTNSMSARDPEVQKALIDDINERLIASTKGVIKAVKEKLTNKWIGNREFLTSALRHVQETTKVMEAIGFDKPTVEQMESEFNLGLIKAGILSDKMLLFNLPNMGNLAFDFQLKQNPASTIYPIDYAPNDDEGDVFNIFPTQGTVQPGESITFSSSFESWIPGTYHQSFDVESAGEKVLSFSVVARVGIPQVEVEPSVVDFGLVRKNKVEFRNIIMVNVGSFGDHWRIESMQASKSEDDTGFDASDVFALSETSGELQPNDSIPIQIAFSPKSEGAFSRKYRAVWSGEPRMIEVKGIGGGARIKSVFLDPADMKFGGLDWSKCIVGCTYEREFQLENTGNVDGIVTVAHPRSSFQFEGPFDTQSRIRIAAGEAINLKMIYSPLIPESVKEPIVVEIEDSPNQLIQLKASAGIRSWAIEGDIVLKNMPVTDIQISSVTVESTGGLDIPFHWNLQVDEKFRNIVKVNIKELKDCKQDVEVTLKPNQLIHPKEHSKISGKLLLFTDLGRGPQSKVFDFDLIAYDKQVALDDSQDATVGRIMFGNTAEVCRDIINYGTSDVKFRVRLEPILVENDLDAHSSSNIGDVSLTHKGKKKKRKSKQNLVDSSCRHQAVYCSFDSMEDKRTVKYAGAKTFLELTDLHKLEPSSQTKQGQLKMRQGTNGPKFHQSNSQELGSAILEYIIEPAWDFDGNIYFAPDTPMTGKLNPADSAELKVLFKPTEIISYETIISVKSQVETKSFRIIGQGALYKFHKDTLPNVIQFGSLGLGETAELPLTIMNGCAYPIQVTALLTATDPEVDPNAVASELLTISPSALFIDPNPANDSPDAEKSRIIATIKLLAPNPLDPVTGLADSRQIANILSKGTKRHFLKLDTVGGHGAISSQIIAVTFQFGIDRLNAMRSSGDMAVSLSDQLTTLEFGEVGMESGGTMTFIVHNQSNLKISFETEIDEKGFAVYPVKGYLNPKAFKEFQVEVKPLTFKEDVEVPPSQIVSGNLKIIPSIESMPPALIALSALLVDGTAKPRQTITIPITFTPQASGDFIATATLETDQGNRTTSLHGVCEEPSIVLDRNRVSFGVVGVKNPEFRNITISNPSKMTVRLTAKSSHRRGFLAGFEGQGEGEMTLAPGETRTLRVIFSPTDQASHEKDTITFYNLDLVPGQVNPDAFASVEVEGVGGTHDFRPVLPLPGTPDDDPFPELPIPELPAGLVSELPTIRVNFPKVVVGQRIRKFFEIENCGDTMVDITLVDHVGRDLAEQLTESSTDYVAYSIQPAATIIPPKQKAKFAVSARGLRSGNDEFWLQVKTRTLTEAKVIPILISFFKTAFGLLHGQITLSTDMLSLQAQEDLRYDSERSLWKVLIPVVRIGLLKPSEELTVIPPVEPFTDLPDITPYTIRPPAIPRDLPPRAKKWYMTRQSMALDQENKFRGLESRGNQEVLARRRQALEFVKPVEKQVYLETRGRRRF